MPGWKFAAKVNRKMCEGKKGEGEEEEVAMVPKYSSAFGVSHEKTTLSADCCGNVRYSTKICGLDGV